MGILATHAIRRETTPTSLSAPRNEAVPLFVDLDGTLVKSDLLLESILRLLKQAPWHLVSMVFWLLLGKARMKTEIARRVDLDTESLPLQRDFVRYLKDVSAQGRPIYLATASDRTLAERLASRVGVFAGTLASDGQRNLRGREKLEAILSLTKGAPFDYAGNAWVDLRVWSKARRGIVVNPHFGVCTAAEKCCSIERVFDDRPAALRAWIGQLRLYQWSKNCLLGVPLLTAHAFELKSLVTILLAFLAFGFVASASYLLNDLADLPSDRRHPRKCIRPFAAGNLALGAGVSAIAILLAVGFAIAALQSSEFFMVLLTYLVLTLSYSFHLKTLVVLDVILLAGLYTIRIIAGAVAIHVQMSSWLLAFSMFTFLSLALVKRNSELVSLQKISRDEVFGRDYRVSDYAILSAMGVASGYLAVVVLALFADSPQGHSAYARPGLLWLLCPLMLYWISRLWIKTARGEMFDDPLLYSIHDRSSWAVFVAMVAVTLVAI